MGCRGSRDDKGQRGRRTQGGGARVSGATDVNGRQSVAWYCTGDMNAWVAGGGGGGGDGGGGGAADYTGGGGGGGGGGGSDCGGGGGYG